MLPGTTRVWWCRIARPSVAVSTHAPPACDNISASAAPSRSISDGPIALRGASINLQLDNFIAEQLANVRLSLPPNGKCVGTTERSIFDREFATFMWAVPRGKKRQNVNRLLMSEWREKIAPRCVLHRGIVKVPCGCCVIYNIPLIAGTSIKKLRLWRWAAAAVAASERPFGLIKRRCEITGRSRAGIILAGPGYDVVLLPQAEQWRYHRYIGVGIGPVWRTCTLHRWGVFTIDGSDTADLPLNEPSSAETMPDSNPKRDYLFGWQVPDADIVVSFYRQKDVRQIIHLVTLFSQFRSVCLHGIYFLVGDDLIRRS